MGRKVVGWIAPTLAAVLWVVALTMWATVAAGLSKGPWGLLAGAVLTALAAVAAGYVPAIRDGVLRRRAELAQLEADTATAREALAGVGELAGESPAGLLDPRRGVAGFVGREEELAGLLAWCQDGRPRGVRLVTGPGGVGKTRLSVELCARLEERGWRWVRAGEAAEGSVLGTARRVDRGRLLVVADYAETRAGLPELLRAVAGDAGPVRVLLLARSAGEWWDRLAVADPAVRELLAGAGAGDLPVAVSADLTDEHVVAAAAPAFAAALRLPAPAGVRVEAGRGPVRVLDLHAAALVAVLRPAGTAGPVRVADVLGELLGHEERFWQGSAARLGLLDGAAGLTPAMLRQVVAAGALLGAASQAEAVGLLGRVPGVTGTVKMAAWLRQLYPPPAGQDSEWLGTLAPDRLAEHLVAGELAASPELARRCLSGLDERQALRAITVLGRAAADQEAAAGLLERLLPLVEQVVAGLPADLGLLTAISAAIPYPSMALAAADLAVTRRILDLVPPDQPGLRARWLNGLGVTLAQTGEMAKALPPAEEAVAAYRELAAADPDRYRPGLALSLDNLGLWFSALGRADEALPVTQEAVAAYRELAAAGPDLFRPDLAISLDNLGNRFSALGRPREALPVTQEAVAAWRELAAADPDRYRPGLALSLDHLGARLWELGRAGEALPVTQEAVAAYRELAAAHPDRYRPDLAISLNNLGVLFSELGRAGEALPVTQEAVAIRRELAAAYPDRYRPDLANSLNNLGVRFAELGRAGEALPVAQEAVAIRRELAAANPHRYRPDLANSLQALARVLDDLGQTAEADAARREAR